MKRTERRPGASAAIISAEKSGASMLDDMEAATAAGGVRVGFGPFEGDLAGADEGVGSVLGPGEFGEERLAGCPPGILAGGGEGIGEPGPNEGPVVLLGERGLEGRKELEARLEGALGTSGGPAAPGPVLGKQGPELFERVGVGGFEDGGDLPGVGRLGGGQALEVEEPGLVRLARGPGARVGEETGP